uniref:Putative secreted protein n=1 Tax=Anopheles triannulatus TaxID=58253 RepID=A0A2M4B374_9DIPT
MLLAHLAHFSVLFLNTLDSSLLRFASVASLVCRACTRSSLVCSCCRSSAIRSSWASKITLDSSILSEYDGGGSSRQKKSRTAWHVRIASSPRIVLMNVCRPCIRLSMNPLLKLSPNHFLRGNTRLQCGNRLFSLLLSRTKSVYRRSTSQQLCEMLFSMRNLKIVNRALSSMTS